MVKFWLQGIHSKKLLITSYYSLFITHIDLSNALYTLRGFNTYQHLLTYQMVPITIRQLDENSNHGRVHDIV